MKTKQAKALIELCQNCDLPEKESIIPPFKNINHYKLDYVKQLKRAQLLEGAILNRIISKNPKTTLRNIRGEYRGNGKNGYYKLQIGHVFFPWLQEDELYHGKSEFDRDGFRYKHNRHFKASYRCLPKISIDYCFTDIILDDTIIDIKTDINTKSYTKYLRQVFIQAVMFEAFLRSKIECNDRHPMFDDFSKKINLIKLPIHNVALYFWRSNHLFKHPIIHIAEPEVFDQIVKIYIASEGYDRGEVRSVIRKNLFKYDVPDIEFDL